MVGADGHVLGIDITPTFVNFMRERVAAKNQEEAAEEAATVANNNVSISLCSPTSTELPNEVADIAFICDVYHHFEYPKTFMASLRQNLKTNGMIYLIDFYRIPEKMTSHDGTCL